MNSSNKKQSSNSDDLLEKSDLSQESNSENESSITYSSSSESEFIAKYKPKSKFFQNPDLFHIRYSSSEPSLESMSSDSEADQSLKLDPAPSSKSKSKSTSNKQEPKSKSIDNSDSDSDSSNNPEIDKIIGINQPDFDESSTQQLMFYVKYKNKSYRSSEWIDENTLIGMKLGKLYESKFMKNETPFRPVHFFNQTVSPLISNNYKLFKPSKVEFDEGFIIPEKIISIRSKKNGTKKFLVKWISLDITESTWETDISEDLIREYEENNSFTRMSCYDHTENKDICDFVELKESPIFKNENSLTDFQVDGLNWLQFCWFKNINSILADEMGLGKTIESISIIDCLSKWYPNWGPFLIVCPVSTISNWLFELKNWTNFRVVCMMGSQESLNMIKKYLIYQQIDENGNVDKEKIIFDVLLISYENLFREIKFISKLNFMYTIIDEAQRIKNFKTMIYQDCMSIRSYHKLLMTGTPIQNNLYEIWSLLHFVDPTNFNDFDTFNNSYDLKNDPEGIDKIQEVIKPYILRRKKSDVNIELPEKEETIIEVEMTQIQRSFSQLIFRNNLGILNDILSTKANLSNIMLQLRKLFCHPFLISKLVEICYSDYKRVHRIPKSTKLDEDQEIETLILASGKMILLDKLLPKLKEGNHKVLIFSQMTKMLDIIEDYINYNGYLYERLDGSCNSAKRTLSINRFQNDENVFIFLLSTRAGGIGINLTGADTVIIYDGDWNPQNDLQAQARCHRIGQTKKVNVYRLITRGCYESEMFLRASQKLALNYAILDSNPKVTLNSDDDQLSENELKMDLQTILRKGAYYTFNDDKNEIDKFCSENIEQILDHRSHSRKDLISGGNSKFSKVSFEAGIDDSEFNKKDFWNKLIGIKSSSDSDDDDNDKKIEELSSSTDTYSNDYEEDENENAPETYKKPASFQEMQQNLYSKLSLFKTNIIQTNAPKVMLPTVQINYPKTVSNSKATPPPPPPPPINYNLNSVPRNSNQNLNKSKVQNKIDLNTYKIAFNSIKKHGIYSSGFFISDFMLEIGETLFLIAYKRLPTEYYQKYLNEFNKYFPSKKDQDLQTKYSELKDENFVSSLFNGKELEFVIEILKKDSIYKAALFVSNEKLPEKYQFAPEMDTPIGWTPIDDFISITSSPIVENISYLIKNEKLPFTKIVKEFPSLDEWIQNRLNLIYNEISLIIPDDYDINEKINGQIVPKKFGTIEKFNELNYHLLHPQKLSICYQKKLLRMFYLYGIPKENGIKKIKSILKIESIFDDKNKDLILIFAVKILIKSLKYNPNLRHLLKSFKYFDFDLINDNSSVDIRWINEEAIKSVASNLDLFFTVRENYSENIKFDGIPECKWWNLKYDEVLFQVTAFYGFLLNSMFCNFIPSKKINEVTIEKWRNEEILFLTPIENPKIKYLGELLSIDKKKARIIQILDFLKSHLSKNE